MAGQSGTDEDDAPVGVASRPTWAQLVISLSPLSLVLVAYAIAGWVSGPISSDTAREGSPNLLGRPLHVTAPAVADERLFGALPTIALQDRFAGATPAWFDAVGAIVYVTHYLALPAVTLLVWLRFRDRFRAWIGAVLTLTVGGTLGYVLYPAAPPWLASEQGVVGPVRRLSTVGWDVLHLGPVGDLIASTQAGSNPVASMPSLHAAVPALILLFLWSPAPRWRTALLAYTAVMALVLVYTGEHYVVDVLAGWLAALVAAVVVRAVTRSRRA